MSSERLIQSGEIRKAKEQLLETEEVGASILQQLGSDRERVLLIKGSLTGVDDEIVAGENVVSRMGKRIHRNKYIMTGLIVFLLFVVLLIVAKKLLGSP